MEIALVVGDRAVRLAAGNHPDGRAGRRRRAARRGVERAGELILATRAARVVAVRGEAVEAGVRRIARVHRRVVGVRGVRREGIHALRGVTAAPRIDHGHPLHAGVAHVAGGEGEGEDDCDSKHERPVETFVRQQ